MVALPFNLPFRQAARFFAKKITLTRPEFDALADFEKLRAFTVATVYKARALQGIMDAVQAAIDDGISHAEFNAMLDDVLDAKLSPWHAELVLRNGVQGAYGSGRWEQQQKQKDDFPFLQLNEVDDHRRRSTHTAEDGTVKPIGDRYWITHYPPWGHGCRGWADSLTEDEARAIGISTVNAFEPDENDEGFTSPGANRVFVPDLSSLASPLRRDVRAALDAFNPAAIDD